MKAFHRLQLETIRTSNDHSIFTWGCDVRTRSILADDPSFFKNCGRMELIGHDEFIQHIKEYIPAEEPDSSRIDSVHSRSRIAASKFGCSSFLILALAPSSKPGCRAAMVQWTHGGPPQLCQSISDTKTCHIATPHSKSTIARSLRMASLAAMRTQ